MLEARRVLLCSLRASNPSIDQLKRYFHDLSLPFGRILSITALHAEPHLKLALEFESAAIALSVLAKLSVSDFRCPFGPLSAELAEHSPGSPRDQSSENDPFPSHDSLSKSDPPGKPTGARPAAHNLLLSSSEHADRLGSPPSQSNRVPRSVPAQLRPEQGAPLAPCASFEEILCSNKNVVLNLANYLFRKEGAARLMFARHLNTDLVRPSMLMNLFCCFGNVQQILIDRESACCLVQYSNSAELAEAVFCLSGRCLFGRTLEVLTCPNFYVNCHPESLNGGSALVVVHGSFSFHRYQSTLNIKYNRPTPVLHLTNIPFEVDHVILFMLIAQVQEPRQIVRLSKTDKKGAPMYLAVFDSSAQAIEALAVLHNKVIQDRSIKASFTAPRAKPA